MYKLNAHFYKNIEMVNEKRKCIIFVWCQSNVSEGLCFNCKYKWGIVSIASRWHVKVNVIYEVMDLCAFNLKFTILNWDLHSFELLSCFSNCVFRFIHVSHILCYALSMQMLAIIYLRCGFPFLVHFFSKKKKIIQFQSGTVRYVVVIAGDRIHKNCTQLNSKYCWRVMDSNQHMWSEQWEMHNMLLLFNYIYEQIIIVIVISEPITHSR